MPEEDAGLMSMDEVMEQALIIKDPSSPEPRAGSQGEDPPGPDAIRPPVAAAQDGPRRPEPLPAAPKIPDGSEEQPETPQVPDTPQLRFRSHDEAERGYRELQGTTTRKDREIAELKKKLNAIDTQEALIRTKTDYEEFVANRRIREIEDIEALDPDAEGYQRQVAGVRASADWDIANQYRTLTTQPAHAAASPGQSGDEGDPPPDDVVAYADAKARELGLSDDDMILFDGFATRAPTADANNQPLTLDAQVQWAVEKTRNFQADLIAKARQKASQPLDRGAPGGPTPPAALRDSGSMGDAMDRAMDMRRL